MNAATQHKTADPAGIQHASVLLIDDDENVQRSVSQRLVSAHYAVTAVGDLHSALETLRKGEFDVVLLDVTLPDSDGLAALQRFKAEAFTPAIVMMSSMHDAHLIVDAMKAGAQDYLTKPLELDKMVATVALAARAGSLERENRRLQKKLRELQAGGELVGCSPALRRLQGVLSRVADTDATVMIEGKPGSGKTLVAHLLHQNGRRCYAPLISMAGDVLSEAAIEAVLLEAAKGTFLIEDVDKMSAPAQSRLVRYLKEKKADGARLIATTSARLPELVARGKFREDLIYRLNVFPVVVPSLQERRDDIALLAMHFVKIAASSHDAQHKGFTASAMALLESHAWPGNVAQLQNAVFRAHALAGSGPIDRQHLLGPSTGLQVEILETPVLRERAKLDDPQALTEEDVLPFEQEEKRLLSNALRATKGNVRRAAQLLRIGRATLYRKIQVYKLNLH